MLDLLNLRKLIMKSKYRLLRFKVEDIKRLSDVKTGRINEKIRLYKNNPIVFNGGESTMEINFTSFETINYLQVLIQLFFGIQ